MKTSSSHSTETLFDRLGRSLKGHLFLFDVKPLPTYDAAAGVRLLLIFLLLEAVIGPRASVLRFLALPPPPVWLRVPVLLGLALFLVCFFARLKLAQIGLRRWRYWNATEKAYFLQTFVFSNALFIFLLADRLNAILADADMWGRAAVVAFANLLWGFYQELVYRGILQTELVRRFGDEAGVLVSDLFFTFGPLHFYHFSSSAPAQALPLFAGIFSIGLYFAVIFQRSGNLAVVGILHGLGNLYIDGLGSLVRRG